MTIAMPVDIGDRVQFKAHGLPDYEHHVGWALDPAFVVEDGLPLDVVLDEHPPLAPVTVAWQDHFGGLPGVVANTDPVNMQVLVRGYDRSGHEFALWIDPKHLDVTRRAMDFSEDRPGV